MFRPLCPLGAGLPDGQWPDHARLNTLAESHGQPVNAAGTRVRFVPQPSGPRSFENGFEPRCFFKGEVHVRASDWHDLFNALVWMTFPATKARINALHMENLPDEAGGQRSPLRDALTMFDEDGVAVFSSDPALLQMVREFRWKELFWNARQQVKASMCFLIFGHALYQKSLRPFVGMTGKAILLQVPQSFMALPSHIQVSQADARLAAVLADRNAWKSGRDLSPLPVLGVPGWWAENKREDFYCNRDYFRPGRRAMRTQVVRSSR
ncbi:MAG: DUF3025 domain-containing protein [Burkholderiales bacterium]